MPLDRRSAVGSALVALAVGALVVGIEAAVAHQAKASARSRVRDAAARAQTLSVDLRQRCRGARRERDSASRRSRERSPVTTRACSVDSPRIIRTSRSRSRPARSSAGSTGARWFSGCAIGSDRGAARGGRRRRAPERRAVGRSARTHRTGVRVGLRRRRHSHVADGDVPRDARRRHGRSPVPVGGAELVPLSPPPSPRSPAVRCGRRWRRCSPRSSPRR